MVIGKISIKFGAHYGKSSEITMATEPMVISDADVERYFGTHLFALNDFRGKSDENFGCTFRDINKLGSCTLWDFLREPFFKELGLEIYPKKKMIRYTDEKKQKRNYFFDPTTTTVYFDEPIEEWCVDVYFNETKGSARKILKILADNGYKIEKEEE